MDSYKIDFWLINQEWVVINNLNLIMFVFELYGYFMNKMIYFVILKYIM